MTIAVHQEQPDHTPDTRGGGHLQLSTGQSQWTDDQRAALTQIGLSDATDADLKVFLHQAQRTGLDPFSRQIYMIARYDSQSGGNKYTIQAGIDGLRLIAERHPQYAGQTDPEWCGEDGQWRDVWLSRKPPAAARVKVIRRDWDLPAVGVAHFAEYAQTKRSGDLTQMWATKSAHMIAKCAEALALRKAFPHDLSGLYTDDEMGNAAVRSPARERVVLNHQPAAPVSADELRGTPPPPDPAPAAEPEPAGAEQVVHDAEPVDADSGEKMSQPQQKKIFALLREHEITDRNDWASGILSRDITSFGQLTAGDAHKLIDTLENAGADQ